MWHDRRVIALLRVLLQLLADLRFVALTFCPRSALQAEILFLRRQLALYQERGVKPRRPDRASRISLALASRLFDWRASLVVGDPTRPSAGTGHGGDCCGA